MVCLTGESLSQDIGVVPSFCLLRIKQQQTLMSRFFQGHKFLFLWDKCPGVQLLDRMVSVLCFKKLPSCVPQGLYHYTFSPAEHEIQFLCTPFSFDLLEAPHPRVFCFVLFLFLFWEVVSWAPGTALGRGGECGLVILFQGKFCHGLNLSIPNTRIPILKP